MTYDIRLTGSFQTMVTHGNIWANVRYRTLDLTRSGATHIPNPASPRSYSRLVQTSMSSALLTDMYELTMLRAALAGGTAHRRAVFEVFARRLPAGRRYGVVAGTGRVLEAIENFRFGEAELEFLERVVDRADPVLPRRLPFLRGCARLPRG